MVGRLSEAFEVAISHSKRENYFQPYEY